MKKYTLPVSVEAGGREQKAERLPALGTCPTLDIFPHQEGAGGRTLCLRIVHLSQGWRQGGGGAGGGGESCTHKALCWRLTKSDLQPSGHSSGDSHVSGECEEAAACYECYVAAQCVLTLQS